MMLALPAGWLLLQQEVKTVRIRGGFGFAAEFGREFGAGLIILCVRSLRLLKLSKAAECVIASRSDKFLACWEVSTGWAG